MARVTTLTGGRKFRLQSGTTVMVRENKKQIRQTERAIARFNKKQEGFVGDLFGGIDNILSAERRAAYDF